VAIDAKPVIVVGTYSAREILNECKQMISTDRIAAKGMVHSCVAAASELLRRELYILTASAWAARAALSRLDDSLVRMMLDWV